MIKFITFRRSTISLLHWKLLSEIDLGFYEVQKILMG